MRKIDMSGLPIYAYVLSAGPDSGLWAAEACYKITPDAYCSDSGCSYTTSAPGVLFGVLGDSWDERLAGLDCNETALQTTTIDLHHGWCCPKEINNETAYRFWELVATKLSEAPISNDMKADAVNMACHLGAIAEQEGFPNPLNGRRYRCVYSNKPLDSWASCAGTSWVYMAEAVYKATQGADIGISGLLEPHDIWCQTRQDGSLGYACVNPLKPWDTLARRWTSHPLLKLWAWELGYAVGSQKINNPYSLEEYGDSDPDDFIDIYAAYESCSGSCMHKKSYPAYYGKLNEWAGKKIVQAMKIMKNGKPVGRCLMWPEVINTATGQTTTLIDRSYPTSSQEIRDGISAWVDEQRRTDPSTAWAIQPNNYECEPSCGHVHLSFEISAESRDEMLDSAMPWFDCLRNHALDEAGPDTFLYTMSSDQRYHDEAVNAQSTEGENCFTGIKHKCNMGMCCECEEYYLYDDLEEINGDYYCQECVANYCVELGCTANQNGWGCWVNARMDGVYCETPWDTYELEDCCGEQFSDADGRIPYIFNVCDIQGDLNPVAVLSDEGGTGLTKYYETRRTYDDMVRYAEDNNLTLIPRAAVKAEHTYLSGGQFEFIATENPLKYLAPEWVAVYAADLVEA